MNKETVVLLGWGRAILLQLAHPLVAAAVGDYSHFHHGAGSYLRRARRTVGAMLAVTFGSAEEAQRAVQQIDAIHHQVNGRLSEAVGIFEAGTPYSAREPRLLLWVHVTLIESLLLTYELLVEPLSTSDKDRYTLEAAWLAEQLGVSADHLPKSYGEVQAHMAQRYATGEIFVGDKARSLTTELLSPPLGPAAAPLFRPTRLITIGLLPPRVREQYRFPWDAHHERAFRRWVGLVRRARRMMPAMLREWPAARRNQESEI